MSNLVIMKNKQVVTTSTKVSDDFGREHRNVMRDIRDLQKDVLNFEQMFLEGNEPDSYGRDRKIYYMNRDGFALLAMGFTGKKALQFKLGYIQAFNQMEKQIQSSQLPMSQEDIMIATLKTQKEIKATLKLVENDIDYLKQEINLSRSQKHRLSGLVRKNVFNALGGKRTQAYMDKNLKARLYSNHWREIKNYFDVEAYEEIPKVRFEESIQFAEMWQPSTELKMLIVGKNSQIPLEV